jgi:neutral trehalase
MFGLTAKCRLLVLIPDGHHCIKTARPKYVRSALFCASGGYYNQDTRLEKHKTVLPTQRDGTLFVGRDSKTQQIKTHSARKTQNGVADSTRRNICVSAAI